MKKSICIMLLAGITGICNSQTKDLQWPQFHGVNGTGIAAESAKPPIIFNNSTLLWRTELPQGVSSPVIWNNKIIVTGFNQSSKELQVICIDSKNGEILWNNPIKPDTIEKFGQISSPAQSTLVTDGERVVAYFGSCGLFCYDMQGKLLWEYRLPCNNNVYGSATSPVISGDKLILLVDLSSKPFLLATSLKNGAIAWKRPLNVNPTGNEGGHSVPLIYKDMIYVHRIGEIACYSILDGSQIWSYKLRTKGITSPVISGNIIMTACWHNLSEESQRTNMPSFNELLKNNDKNHNGTLSNNEIPEDLYFYKRPETPDSLGNTSGTVKRLFSLLDPNKDGEITQQEWDSQLGGLIKTYYKPAGLLAFSVQNKGELTDKDILWRITENIPEVPSPIFYKNRIYMIRDGGIISCVNPKSGQVIYSTRIGNSGAYIASPVAANGYLYLIAYNGKMKIVKAGDKFEVSGEFDFKDKVEATPAIIGNAIYIRTGKELVAYSKK